MGSKPQGTVILAHLPGKLITYVGETGNRQSYPPSAGVKAWPLSLGLANLKIKRGQKAETLVVESGDCQARVHV